MKLRAESKPTVGSWSLVVYQLCFSSYLIFYINSSALWYYVVLFFLKVSLLTSVIQCRREWIVRSSERLRKHSLVTGCLVLSSFAIYVFSFFSHLDQLRVEEYSACLFVLSILALPPLINFGLLLADDFLRRDHRSADSV